MNFNDIFKSSFLENVSSISIPDMLLTIALAFAGLVTLTLAGALTGALLQQILGPGHDLVAIGGNDINHTGNGSQSGQDLHNSLKAVHKGKPPNYKFI